ncbi:hypothetical protein QFZ82_007559 [Streptomyces sp. V4I23]|nr:hypothetical protein [Streptomyces sp. V4I23]
MCEVARGPDRSLRGRSGPKGAATKRPAGDQRLQLIVHERVARGAARTPECRHLLPGPHHWLPTPSRTERRNRRVGLDSDHRRRSPRTLFAARRRPRLGSVRSSNRPRCPGPNRRSDPALKPPAASQGIRSSRLLRPVGAGASPGEPRGISVMSAGPGGLRGVAGAVRSRGRCAGTSCSTRRTYARAPLLRAAVPLAPMALRAMGATRPAQSGGPVPAGCSPGLAGSWPNFGPLTSPFRLGTAGFGAETRKCLPDLGR